MKYTQERRRLLLPFASDIHCHKRCINNYLLKYNCCKSADENPKNIEKKIETQKSFDGIMSEISLNENGYSLSEIEDRINTSLNAELLIENRKVKELLIQKYGVNVCFTYPMGRTKSQMFYSTHHF